MEDHWRIFRGSWETVEGSREKKGRLWDDLRRFLSECIYNPINTGMQEGPGRIIGGSLEDCWNIVRGSWEDCERLFVQSIVIGS